MSNQGLSITVMFNSKLMNEYQGAGTGIQITGYK